MQALDDARMARVTSANWAKLEDLIARQQQRGSDIRPMLLRMLTDVYVTAADPGADDDAQYADIVLRLVETVDAETRELIAHRLRACPHAPAALIERLERPPAPPAAARPQEEGDATIGQRFFAADAAERRRMLTYLDGASPPPLSADCVRAVAVLENSALAGHPGEFIKELEHALKVARETAERIVNDVGGEPMVVAAHALGMPLAVLQRILMFLNPAIGHSVRRIYELSDLYEQVTPSAAHRLAATWRLAAAGERTAAAATMPAAMRERRDDDGLRATATTRPAGRRLPLAGERRGQRTS
jgi:hypothetical protein